MRKVLILGLIALWIGGGVLLAMEPATIVDLARGEGLGANLDLGTIELTRGE